MASVPWLRVVEVLLAWRAVVVFRLVVHLPDLRAVGRQRTTVGRTTHPTLAPAVFNRGATQDTPEGGRFPGWPRPGRKRRHLVRPGGRRNSSHGGSLRGPDQRLRHALSTRFAASTLGNALGWDGGIRGFPGRQDRPR